MWNKLTRSGWRAAEKSGAQGSIAARTRNRSRLRVWQPAPANRHRSSYSDTLFDTRQTMADQLRALVAARDGPKNNAEHKGGWAVARRAAGLRVGRLRRPTPRLLRCPADKLAQTKLREKELKDAHKAELEQQKQKKEEVRRRARGGQGLGSIWGWLHALASSLHPPCACAAQPAFPAVRPCRSASRRRRCSKKSACCTTPSGRPRTGGRCGWAAGQRGGGPMQEAGCGPSVTGLPQSEGR